MSEEKIQFPAGVKRTKQRESVFKVLQNAEKPLSATEICDALDDGSNRSASAWLSTVYRTLELFVRKDFVIKTNLTNSDMAVYELNRFEHKHYAVCVSCRKIIELGNCPFENFVPQIKDEDFHVLGHKLELFGLCKTCNSA